MKLSWKTSHALTNVELQELFIIIIITPKIFIISDEKLVTIFLSFFCITLKFHNIQGVPKKYLQNLNVHNLNLSFFFETSGHINKFTI